MAEAVQSIGSDAQRVYIDAVTLSACREQTRAMLVAIDALRERSGE